MTNGFTPIHRWFYQYIYNIQATEGNIGFMACVIMAFLLIAIVPHALAPTIGLHRAPLAVWLANMVCYDNVCSSLLSSDLSPSFVDYPFPSGCSYLVSFVFCCSSAFSLSLYFLFLIGMQLTSMSACQFCFSRYIILPLGSSSLAMCWSSFLSISLPSWTLVVKT